MQVLTEEELDALHELKEAYWEQFSALVRDTVLKAPRAHRPHLMVLLEESSSCHGSKYAGDALR